MDLSQSSILRNELSCLGLHLLSVLLNFNGVLPSNRLAIFSLLTLRISDDVLEVLCLIDHHWLLAIDHLSTHGVIEVSNLFERYTFLIEFLSIFGYN